jgi:hypothetical protein
VLRHSTKCIKTNLPLTSLNPTPCFALCNYIGPYGVVTQNCRLGYSSATQCMMHNTPDLLQLQPFRPNCHTSVNMSTRVWQELEYRIDVCRVTPGAHIEHL